MTSPNIPISDEVAYHLRSEIIAAVDWGTNFSTHIAAQKAAKADIAATDNPDKLLYGIEVGGRAIVGALGSGLLYLFKLYVEAERASFVADFGE